MSTTLTAVIYGDSGAGKTMLAVTAPGPRLILDAEGGTQFAAPNAIKWNPTDNPPEVGPNDTVVVQVKTMQTLNAVMQWVTAPKFPFKSVIVDSLMEVQKRLIDNTAGTEAMQMRDWGVVLRQMESFVRLLRDQTMNNGHSIPCIIFTAGADEKDGYTRPLLQGQISKLLPYFVDVQGYLAVAIDENGEPERRLLIAPVNNIKAKDRTGVLTAHYGISIKKPNLTTMMQVLEDANANTTTR